jgi:hypothetical protein
VPPRLTSFLPPLAHSHTSSSQALAADNRTPSRDARHGDPFASAAISWPGIRQEAVEGRWVSTKIGSLVAPSAVGAGAGVGDRGNRLAETSAHTRADVVLGGAGVGTGPAAGHRPQEMVGGVLPATATAAHGDPLLAASGLAPEPQRHTDADEPTPRPFAGHESLLPDPTSIHKEVHPNLRDTGEVQADYTAIIQHDYASAPSQDARHGDPLLAAVSDAARRAASYNGGTQSLDLYAPNFDARATAPRFEAGAARAAAESRFHVAGPGGEGPGGHEGRGGKPLRLPYVHSGGPGLVDAGLVELPMKEGYEEDRDGADGASSASFDVSRPSSTRSRLARQLTDPLSPEEEGKK